MVSLRSVACLGLTLVICVLTLTAAEEPVDEFVPPEGLAVGWFARIDTSEGRIIARLLPDQAPQSVAHFAALAQGRLEWFDEVLGQLQTDPYYDGVQVHRVVAGRLFEAGKPPGVGRVAPEFLVRKEGSGPINFSRPGRLGMVSDFNGISGVKFLVTVSGQNLLNRMSPCFGEIVSGLDAAERISQAKAYRNGKPIEPPVIERIRIFSVGQVAPLPEPEPYVDPRTTPSLKPKKPKPEAPPATEKTPPAPDDREF